MRKNQIIGSLIVALIVMLVAGMTMAQPGGGGGRGGMGGGMMGGNFDPAQMQQMRMQRMQEQLGMSDTEMKAIEPMLTKVMELRQELQSGAMRGGRGGRGGMGGMMGGGRGGRGQQNAAELTGLAKIASELSSMLEGSADTAAIKAKLAEYRKARTKLQEDIKAAQAKLVAVLTAKQEATLVMSGTLD